MNPFQVPHRLHTAGIPYSYPDPGDGEEIAPDRQFAICEITTVAAETRTLADPLYPKQDLTLSFKVDGGDVTITADSGVNQSGNTSLVAADSGDHLKLEAIDAGTAATADLQWRVVANDGWSLS